LEKTKANRVEPIRNWILEANHGEKMVSDDNFGEMKAFLQKVGLNRVFHDQTLTVSFLKPWSALAETNLATRADNGLSLTTSKWWRWWDLKAIPTGPYWMRGYERREGKCRRAVIL